MNGKLGFKGLSRRVALAALLSAIASTAAFPQSFPSRNVSIVTTVSAGGSIDAVARIIAAGLTKSLGKSVIVEAKPGAGGNVAAGYVANQPPDGHTLIMGNSATVTTNPHIYKSIPFDAEKSFTPIIIPARVNQILVVNPKVQAKTFEEFVVLMKANPGKLNYGSSGIGASSHLGAEAGAARTDHPMLRAAAAFDLRVRKRIPVRRDLAEAGDPLGQQFVKRHVLQFVGDLVLDGGHALLLLEAIA